MIEEDLTQPGLPQRISPFKKAVIVFLSFSEVGLSPFLANAIIETLDISSDLFHSDLSHEAKLSIGYGLAIPYVISAMLSIGDLDETARYLFTPDSKEHAINPFFKHFHRFMIGSSFLLGSTAAGIGVLQNWGSTYPFYFIAAYAVAGQMSVVLLQANKRIMGSADSVCLFFRHPNKLEMMKDVIKKPTAIINTSLNTLYWGAFYYYVGANISQLLSLPEDTQLGLSASSAYLGAYMAFFTQGVDELKNTYSKDRGASQSRKKIGAYSRYLTVPLISGSFCCRTLATVSFAYACFNGQSITNSEFNKTVGIAALAMLLPASFPAIQYVKYISSQVDQAVKGIGSNLNRNVFSWFRKKASQDSEEASLLRFPIQ